MDISPRKFVCVDDDLATYKLRTVQEVIAESCGVAVVADVYGDNDDDILEDGDRNGNWCTTTVT